MKNACVGVLSIIELKNARWNIEIEISVFAVKQTLWGTQRYSKERTRWTVQANWASAANLKKYEKYNERTGTKHHQITAAPPYIDGGWNKKKSRD